MRSVHDRNMTILWRKATATVIRRKRGERTVAALAKVCRMGQSKLSTMESGVQGIKLDTLRRVASGFGLPCWELVKEIEDEARGSTCQATPSFRSGINYVHKPEDIDRGICASGAAVPVVPGGGQG